MNPKHSEAQTQNAFMMEELSGCCSWRCFRTDDDGWYMSATAKGWLPGIKPIVGFWSSAASLIEHNDQQSSTPKIGVLN